MLRGSLAQFGPRAVAVYTHTHTHRRDAIMLSPNPEARSPSAPSKPEPSDRYMGSDSFFRLRAPILCNYYLGTLVDSMYTSRWLDSYLEHCTRISYPYETLVKRLILQTRYNKLAESTRHLIGEYTLNHDEGMRSTSMLHGLSTKLLLLLLFVVLLLVLCCFTWLLVIIVSIIILMRNMYKYCRLIIINVAIIIITPSPPRPPPPADTPAAASSAKVLLLLFLS